MSKQLQTHRSWNQLDLNIYSTPLFIVLQLTYMKHFLPGWLLSSFWHSKVQDTMQCQYSDIPAVVVLTCLDMNTRVLFGWDQDKTPKKLALFLEPVFWREILILVFGFFSVFGWTDHSDSLQTDPWTWQQKHIYKNLVSTMVMLFWIVFKNKNNQILSIKAADCILIH